MRQKHKTQRVIAKKAFQKDLDAGMKVDGRAIVDVEWLDACAHMAVEKIDSAKLKDLLCPSHTMGKVVAQDDEVICVATHVSAASGIDLMAIPIKWVKSISIFET